MKTWLSRWDQSPEKFKTIKPRVQSWPNAPGGNRRNEVKLKRIHIGHNRLTHGYHISRGRSPEYEHCACGEPLTVKLILIDCPEIRNLRTQMMLPDRLYRTY